MATRLKVVVVGGSLGGLTAASTLLAMGCDVHLYERSPTVLDSRGAGIVLHRLSERFLVERGVDVDSFATRAGLLRYVDGDGATITEAPVNYRFTAWTTLYRALLERFPPARYHLGQSVTEAPPADLVVWADGVRSQARARFFPDLRAAYSGYVGWRGILPEAELGPAARAALGDAIVYHLRPGSHVLTYPIPGPERGGRLLNFVWYRNVDAVDLPDLLTDAEGRIRDLSVPAGQVSVENVESLRRAAALLPAPLAELICAVPEPFLQAIVDVKVQRMAIGSECLLGDAAFVARPHAAAGTAKAASDAWALRDALVAHGGRVAPALAGWERTQLRLGTRLVDRVRAMGDAIQFGAGWTPGDSRLRFGLIEPGDSEEE